ncbi:MAG: DUF5667 domain-containing protein [Minisyncoccales bacterium]
MNKDKILIKKIRELKKIKPESDWVFSLKHEILKTRFSPFFVFRPLPVFSFIFVFTIIVLKTIFALPGERLYFVKKTLWETRNSFFVKEQRPEMMLAQIDERLKELENVSFKNETKKMPAVFEEYQKASQESAKMIREGKINPQKIFSQKETLKEIVARQQNVRASLNSPSAEMKDFNCTLFEKYQEDLKERTLREKDEEIFKKAIDDFKKGNCLDALTKVLYLGNNE